MSFVFCYHSLPLIYLLNTQGNCDINQRLVFKATRTFLVSRSAFKQLEHPFLMRSIAVRFKISIQSHRLILYIHLVTQNPLVFETGLV